MHTTCPDCGSDNPLTGGPNGKLPHPDNPYGPRDQGEGNGTTIMHIHIPREDGKPTVISPHRQKGHWCDSSHRALDATPCDDCGSTALVDHLLEDFKLEMAVRICKRGPYCPNTYAFCAEQLVGDEVNRGGLEVEVVDFQELDKKGVLVGGLLFDAADKVDLADVHRDRHRISYQKCMEARFRASPEGQQLAKAAPARQKAFVEACEKTGKKPKELEGKGLPN